MSYASSKNRLKSTNEHRDLLVGSLRTHLLPVLVQQGFASAPPVHRGPVDRELVLSLPLGRLVRAREPGVDLIQVEFARYRRAAFRIMAGVAPRDGLMTYTGHWAAEDVLVGWLNEFFEMCDSRWRRKWFSAWRWLHQAPVQGDYERLALRVASYVPELEFALREGRLGPHMRRVVIPRPPIEPREVPTSQSSTR